MTRCKPDCSAAIMFKGSCTQVSDSSCSPPLWISLISWPSARDRGTNQRKQLLLLYVWSMNTCSVLVLQFVHRLPSWFKAEVFRRVRTQHQMLSRLSYLVQHGPNPNLEISKTKKLNQMQTSEAKCLKLS